MSAQPLPPLQGGMLVIATIGISVVTAMTVLDSTIANVALPTIAGNLGVASSQGTWVITFFGVANAIAIPLTGWLARRMGEVRLYFWSTFLFVAASFLCGISNSLGMLIICRILQGAAAGPLIPLSQSLLLACYPREKRGIALSLWSMTIVLAPIGIFPVFLSPLIGRFAQRIDMRVIVTMSFLVFSAAFYLRTLFSPDVDFAFVLWPQVVQGIGVALFFMPLTSIIISGLDARDIANASSLSNCTRVLAGSIGSSLATTMWERQEALHHVRLTESINPFNPAAQHGLNQLTQMGLSPEQAKVWVANEITRQGFLLGFNELFWLASIAFIGLAGLVWLSTPINKKIR